GAPLSARAQQRGCDPASRGLTRAARADRPRRPRPGTRGPAARAAATRADVALVLPAPELVEARRKPEEREEARGVEEERELEDPRLRHLEHLERPRVVARAALARLVLPEGREAVRRAGREHLRALAADTRPEPPLEH